MLKKWTSHTFAYFIFIFILTILINIAYIHISKAQQTNWYFDGNNISLPCLEAGTIVKKNYEFIEKECEWVILYYPPYLKNICDYSKKEFYNYIAYLDFISIGGGPPYFDQYIQECRGFAKFDLRNIPQNSVIIRAALFIDCLSDCNAPLVNIRRIKNMDKNFESLFVEAGNGILYASQNFYSEYKYNQPKMNIVGNPVKLDTESGDNWTVNPIFIGHLNQLNPTCHFTL